MANKNERGVEMSNCVLLTGANRVKLKGEENKKGKKVGKGGVGGG